MAVDQRLQSSDEGATSDVGDAELEALPDEQGRFDEQYVRQLRSESAQRRIRVRELEVEVAELRADRDQRVLVDAIGDRMADPEDLARFVDVEGLRGDDGRLDPERIVAAVDELLAARPHPRKHRSYGDAEQGARIGPPPVRGMGETLSEMLQIR